MPPETKTETQKQEGTLPEAATKVLEEIKERLDKLPNSSEEKPVVTTPSWQEEREGRRKTLGFSEEQMQAHEQTILKSQAPIIEQSGWNRLEKRSDIETYRTEIEKELSIYPQERRTPEIMEKIYYFVKGKHADSKPVAKPSDERIVDTRVTRGPGYSGADPGLSGGRSDGGAPSDAENLDDNEKFVAGKLGVSEKDYAAARNVGRSIGKLKPQYGFEPKSSADLELKRLMGR